MRSFQRLLTGVDVSQVGLQLALHAELWNANKQRTSYEGSPHRDVDDIWLRWKADERSERVGTEAALAPFFPVWLPAERALPAVRPLVHALASTLQATFMGGVLITRIPAGRQVFPHSDKGGWHAEQMNAKLYLPLVSNDSCVNVCDGEEVVMRQGEVWMFDNIKVHSVVNRGESDRVTLIVCLRVE